MKFTKEDARKELTEKLSPKVENISKWERTIKENIETLWSLLGDGNEVELSDFITRALPLFETTAGFIRKENSDLAKSYEEKIKELKPKVTTTTDDDNHNAELLRRLEELEAKNKLAEQKVLIDEVRGKILAKVKELGVKDKTFSEKLLSMVSIDEKSDVDATANQCLELYNSIKADEGNLTTPKRTRGTETDYASDIIKEAASLAKSQRL